MFSARLSMKAGFSCPRKFVRRNGASRFRLLMLFAAAMLCVASPAKAKKTEYRLHVGDVIEISVARAPELKQRVPVQLDGSISFPMMGNLPVAGLTPSEAQSRIQAILATKVFRQRISDGRENEIMIDHDEVTATVVEYRPIYVNGDVSKPGEYSYRPLMTVRQAVALSGGYELMRYRMQNPVLEAADLRAEYETLWAEFAKEQAHVWRLKTELGENKHLDQSSLKDLPLSQSTISEIVHVEAEQLPRVDLPGAQAVLIAGTAYGRMSPVAVFAPMFLLDVQLSAGAELTLPLEHVERGIHVVEGAVSWSDLALEATQMAVQSGPTAPTVRAREASRLVAFGGAPLDGERHLWWNFVASTPVRIEQAKADWVAGRFARVPGDEDDFIPLP